MDRRDFLEKIAKSILLMAAAPVLLKCSNTTTAPATTGNTYTSQPDNTGHSHTFLVPTTALQSPANGYSGSTSAASDYHVHTVTLTSVDLSNIAAGASVSKTTSVAVNHTHNFVM